VARILVVDDEPDVRELFNITLKMAGHTTETAKDGVDAVTKLENEIPDLVLLDLMMPRLDGFGLLTHIRSKMDTKPMRVLVATAKVLEEMDKDALASWPVVGVLNKGELDIGRMVTIVSDALGTDPLRTNPLHTSPSHTTTSHTGPAHTAPSHTSPSRTSPSRTNPPRTSPLRKTNGHD
jgi:CheY-like chemotaxis protein